MSKLSPLGACVESLKRGVQLARDPATIRVATVPFLGVMVFVGIGSAWLMTTVKDIARNPLNAMSDLPTVLSDLGAWFVLITLVGAFLFLWETLAVGILSASASPVRLPELYRLALRRIPAVLGAWILIPVSGVALFLLWLILRWAAGKLVLSFLVSLLMFPFLICCALWLVVGIASFWLVPALASGVREAGPIDVLKRSVGLIIKYPESTFTIIGVSVGIASVTATIFVTGVAFSWATLIPIVTEMIESDHTLSTILAVLSMMPLLMLAVEIPRLFVVGALASYARMVGGDQEIAEVPELILRTTQQWALKTYRICSATAEVLGMSRIAKAIASYLEEIKNRAREKNNAEESGGGKKVHEDPPANT